MASLTDNEEPGNGDRGLSIRREAEGQSVRLPRQNGYQKAELDDAHGCQLPSQRRGASSTVGREGGIRSGGGVG